MCIGINNRQKPIEILESHMLKRKNKKLQGIAATLTVIFAVLSITTLFFRSEDSKESRYLGIKPDGQMVTLKLKDNHHADF
jgi:hypothetical protein